MDPNATLADLIDAAVAGDDRELRDATFRLIGWLRDGGFPPDDPRDQRRQLREGRLVNGDTKAPTKGNP